MSIVNPKIRSRFAPSPTGFVHIGSLRTALFSFLFAKHNGGVNVLRVEDTDRNRLVDGAVTNMLSVMTRLGLEFDEGPVILPSGELGVRGEFGPYVQSERQAIYKDHAAKLISKGQAYECYCSSERLDALRAEQTALKKPTRYDSKCRNLTEEERATLREQLKSENKGPVVRFAMPTTGTTEWEDLVYGKISYENNLLDDHVLMKSDGFPTYHLAVVVDDHLMEISHVIRGEDWLPSTPKHIATFKAFGFEIPFYGHCPLITNPDRTKLSKRQGDVSVEDFLAKGYLEEALVNFTAFLGWNPKSEKEIFSMSELISEFKIENVGKSGAVFDLAKLDWINGQFIKKMSAKELAVACETFFQELGIDFSVAGERADEFKESVVLLEQQRAKTLRDIAVNTAYVFNLPDFDPNLLVWRKSNAAATVEVLKKLHEFISNLGLEVLTDGVALNSELQNFVAANGYDNGTVYWPLRVAQCGLQNSPGPLEILPVLVLGFGKDEVLRRLSVAVVKLENSIK